MHFTVTKTNIWESITAVCPKVEIILLSAFHYSDFFLGLSLKDGNGTIENEELRGFLKDLLELVKSDYDATDLKDFEDTIMKGCDFNRDGKISKKELTMILLALSKQSQED